MKRIFLIATLLLQAWMAQAAFRITGMKVSGLSAPIGIDQPTPTFSWQIQSEERGFRQCAYQIVVTDDSGNEVWNSGTVSSSLQNNIEYQGRALQSRTGYHWTVTVFSNDNGSESAASSFETAFMSPMNGRPNGSRRISRNLPAALP